MRPSEYSEGPYPITKRLIEDGRKHLLLGGLIETGCPVHILQGVQDPDVPWRHARGTGVALCPRRRGAHADQGRRSPAVAAGGHRAVDRGGDGILGERGGPLVLHGRRRHPICATPRIFPAAVIVRSAHTAAPRTSGEASSSKRSASRCERSIAGIADGDQHIAHEAVAAGALDRGLGEQRAELRVVEARKLGERWARASYRARRAWLRGPRARTCSTGRPRGNRRSHRCGCPWRARNSRGIGPLCSMVRYEMQRRASSR